MCNIWDWQTFWLLLHSSFLCMHLQIKIKFFDALRKVGQVFFQHSIYMLLKWNVLNLGDDFQNLIQLQLCGWCIFSTQNAENSICWMNLKIQNTSKTLTFQIMNITIWEIHSTQSLEFDNSVLLCENSLVCRNVAEGTWNTHDATQIFWEWKRSPKKATFP